MTTVTELLALTDFQIVRTLHEMDKTTLARTFATLAEVPADLDKVQKALAHVRSDKRRQEQNPQPEVGGNYTK